MKLLWISNAPWMPSGYGSQTRQVGPRIRDAGYDIEFVANDGTRGDSTWNGMLVRGSGDDRYSRDSVREDLRRSQADWVISLYDAWVYTEGRSDPFEGVPNVAAWVPVDHYPVPMSLYQWLANGHVNIAMSRFGEASLRMLSNAWASKEAREQGLGPFTVRYAPHAVDEVFQPNAEGGAAFRQSIGVPQDAFLVGIVAANYGSGVYDRKGMSDMAAALGMFMAANPDAYVYVHSITEGAGMMNLDILFAFEAVPTDRLRFADQYRMKKHDYSDADMAAMYSGFDVLLATSRGEGFGVPVIEAQACGTPVIASNWTAQAELVGDVWREDSPDSKRCASGWLVAVTRDYDQRQGGCYWGRPLHRQIAGALQEAHERKGDPQLHDAALERASHYRADVVFEEHWKPLLAEMARGSIAPPQIAPRKERRAAERKAKKAA